MKAEIQRVTSFNEENVMNTIEVNEVRLRSPLMIQENVFDFVKYTGTLDRRVQKLWAKEKAMEDALVVIKKLFEDDRIDFHEFTGQVRKIARKQFMAIAKRNKATYMMQSGLK